MALGRLKQILVREEAHPGTLQSPLSASYGKYLVIDPACTREFARHERNLSRDTLTMPHGLIGLRKGRITFGLEMAGQAATTPDVPAWDLLMRACGMKSVATSRIAIGAITDGPFRHGETITFSGTGSGTATVLHDTYSGTAYLYYYNLSSGGSAASGATITGGNGGTATSSGAGADAGQSWFPISKHTSQISYTGGTGTQFAVGTPIKGATSGARAMVTAITLTSGTWGTSDGAGVITFRYYSGTFQSGEEIQNASSTGNHCDSSSAASQVDIPSVSIALIEDGHADVVTGARGTVTIDAKIGEPVRMNFDFLGTHLSPATVADQALVSGVAYDSQIPPVFLGAGMALGSEGDTNTAGDYQPRITAFQLDVGNELYVRENASVGDGMEDCVITGRTVSGSFDPELDVEASYPFFKHAAGVSSVYIARCNFSVGSTAGNKFYASLPGMQLEPPTTGDRGGLLTYQIPFRATGGYYSTEVAATIGSDNEFCLTYLLV